AGPGAERGGARRARVPGSRRAGGVRALARRAAPEGGPGAGGGAVTRTARALALAVALGMPAAARAETAAAAPEVLTVEDAVAQALQANRRVAMAAMEV